jgi:signal transduction histidine kinase/ligand-binding sensor domain-containing protein
VYDKGTIHLVFRSGKLLSQQTFFTGNDPPKSPGLEVMHIYQQNDTTAWLSTNEGLVKLNPALNQYQVFSRWEKKAVKELKYTALSSNGQLWVATGPSGIYTFDTKTLRFVNNFRNDKSYPFSLCSDNIVSLYFDRMNNLWCGSYGSGASYTNIENVFFKNHISKNDLPNPGRDNTISWLGFSPGEDIWCLFASTEGIWVLDKNLTVISRKYPLLENGAKFQGYTNKLLFDPDNNNVWYATNKGLFIYNIPSNRLRPVKYQLLSGELMGSNWINDIIRLKDHSIIFSTFAGLYRVTRESGQLVVKPFTTLNQEDFIGYRSMFQDEEGFVYVKGMSDMLYILQPNNSTNEYELKKRINFSPRVNYYFYNKEEKLTYLATTDGLYFINTKNLQAEKKRYNNKAFSSNISSVFKKDGRYWVFGEKGIHFYDEKNNSGRTFTTEDGLPTNEFSPSALVYTPDGRCIAGSSNGLVSFFPGEPQHPIYPPGVQLTKIYVNDIADSSFVNADEIKTLELSYRENTFSFDFAPISYHHAADCSFEYKLEGYDDDWIKSGPANYTRYSKIPPGNYVFNLRVMDITGKTSPFTKAIEIRVARAFWQTWLFKALALASILLVAWLVSKWYLNQRIRKQKQEFEKQQAIERERTRIATDMHDDLGAGLSRIKFISQSISHKKPVDDTIKTELEKITVYSDEMSEKMGEIVWALNEKNDTLADLIAYTRSYAIEYLAHHHIACRANTPLGLPGNFIPGEMRRNIFLSVKECLHNIVKHAGATCVNFTVELGHTIRITIHDNGRGIDWDNKRAFSNGLQNIRQRMNDVNGDVNFSNEQGTKVLLTIPL